jgi:hypothetical protein
MKTILKARVGSHLYGLNTEHSDEDYLGVFVRPTEEVLSMFNNEETYVSKNPDCTLHEVKKFIHLAAKGNPTVLELLYCPEYEVATYEGCLLVNNRELFLSDHVRDSFGGYAIQQARKGRSKFERMQGMFADSSIKELRKKYGEERWLRKYLQDLSIGATEEIVLERCGKESGEKPFEGSPTPDICKKCREPDCSEKISSKERLQYNRGTSRGNSKTTERPVCNLWRNNARVCRPQSRNGESSGNVMPEMQQGIRSFQRQSRFTPGSCELFRAYLRYEKNARHCFRLMRQGKQLLETGTMNPRISNPEEYFALGELPSDELIAKFEEEFKVFESTQSVLLSEPNWKELDKLLLMIRELN